MPKISAEGLIDEAMRLFELGYATADIGLDLNVSVNTLSNWARQRGIKRPDWYEPQKPIPYKLKEEANGLSLEADCKRLLKLLEQERGQRLAAVIPPRMAKSKPNRSASL